MHISNLYQLTLSQTILSFSKPTSKPKTYMQNPDNNANNDEQEGRPIHPTNLKTMPLFSNNLFAKGLSELSSTPQRVPATLDPQGSHTQPPTLPFGGLTKS